MSQLGDTRLLDLDLEGGKTLTVRFGISRFLMFRRMWASSLAEQVWMQQWPERFSDLVVERVYLGGELEGR